MLMNMLNFIEMYASYLRVNMETNIQTDTNKNYVNTFLNFGII